MKKGQNPQLNPDGVSIKGCSIIYAPAGQAGEYSALASNPYRGCGNECVYCYVPGVLRMSRKEFDAGAVARPNFLRMLERDAVKYRALGITEQVMLSFTTDPYHPGDNGLTRDVLKMLQQYGLGICTLTKGGHRALRDLDLFRPGRDAFASTLTALDDAFSLRWERSAALPADRINTLRTFHEAGIFTWVSLEPVLDTAATLEIIRQTHTFVDLYKVGRANYIGLTKTTDWKQFTHDVLRVLAEVGARHYIKRALQPHLPTGYDNPVRVRQFRVTNEQESLPILR
jgi:DNA repair photolyase